jgi:hypothetical protein
MDRFKLRRVCKVIWIFLLLSNAGFGQGYGSLVVSEVMADPTPVLGLPAVEYLELFNRSEQNISLKNWKLRINLSLAIFPDSIIEPRQYLVVCSKANVKALNLPGKVVGLTTFSLPNEGGTVSLYESRNQLVFSISYESSWWESGKRDGGYALELLDADNPCGGQDNWQASKDVRGGSPGQQNSVKGYNPDVEAPVVERAEVVKATVLKLVADERLDSSSAVSGAVITLAGRKIVKKELESPQFRTLILTLDSPLLAGESYHLAIKNLSDCTGNPSGEANFSVGLPSEPDSGDVVLNEILFNPPAGGVDFVEIYNRSAKYINLKNWSLGLVKNGEPDIFKTISMEDFILPPYAYLALTAAPDLVKGLYPTETARSFLRLTSLPAYPNTEGGVILAGENQQVYDRFDYREDMHDPFMQDRKGISLEKADAGLSSGLTSNWHSAAFTAGNATPGYANSQKKTGVEKDTFDVEPEAFMPGNNGTDGAARIRYKLSQTGQIATIRIFDINGRLVKNLLGNQLIGTEGEILWEGRNENGDIVPTGYYLVLIDLFDSAGFTRQYKRKVVVVRN